MLFRRGPVASRAKERKTKREKNNKLARILVAMFLGVFVSVFAFNSLADIIDGNDVRVDVDSDLTYYLSVKEDGVDASGIESSDSQMADIRGGRITVTDKLPEGLIFQGFVTTSDGTIGAVSRSDSSIQCPGKVIDDTDEATLDTGTWNNTHTEYYYHGLHYNDTTRTVSFMAEKIKAGCQLTIGIITKTPATIDDPDTTLIETRRDFYNTAFAAEKDVTAISNTVHAWIGSSNTRVYRVMYSYTGDIPTGAPMTPGEQFYAENSNVAVGMNPTLEGYTFSGWTTSDATVTDGSFTMPGQNVELIGIWTKNATATKYTVTYVVNGNKPADFMPPTQKEYEAGVSVPLDSTEANAVIDGYRFSGWSTTDADISETGFTMPAQNVTIVGSFTRISYTVCYEFEGATIPPNASSLLPPCETHYPGDTVTTASDPTASGYNFLGWYKNASFTMPEENVVIQGEWMQALGKFAPTITKEILNPKSEYMYGETVKFKITVTNTAAFEITDVYLEGKLPGAVFTEPQDDSYTTKTSTIAFIPSIAAGTSVSVYAEYKVTENVAQTLTNIVELTGALADGYALDTSQDYEAEVDFDTVPEPVPFTGVIFKSLPYVGMVALGIVIIFIGVILSRKATSPIVKLTRIYNLEINRVLKYSIPCFAIIGIILGGIIAKSVSAANYTEVIKSIELASQHTSYANNTPGSWNVEKSATWIAPGKARITFDVNTIAKVADNVHLDLVMVIDNSGSMSGDKIAQVKHDATELIESVLSDNNNRIGLVSFNSSATKLSDLSSDKTSLINLVNGLDTPGDTNYYVGFLKAEEILEGYQKQENRELIMLFLTDGFPNNQTPNEIPEYRAIKAMYPYMTINGIQYEMGDEVLDPIKAVTDNQFIANRSSLNNVLFEASIAPYVYSNFSLVDYINDEYWDVDSVDAIEASVGEATLIHEGSTPVVTWTMNEVLMSGRSARLSVDITLKNADVIAENAFLPTNDHETIESSLPETPDENITSELTPVLKSSYKVTYEPNLPSTCSTYEGTLPVEQNYLPLSVVERSNSTISCNGYNFNGWEIADGDPKVLNDDYFKIIDDDVVLRATWTKPSISKSMDGEVNEEVTAVLDTGQNINVALKKLAGQSSATYSTSNTSIKSIKAASSMSAAQQASASVISATSSAVPIYAWFDDTDGTIYIYSEADIIKAGARPSYLAYNMKGLVDIEGIADWNISEAKSMQYMFYGASAITDIEALSGWDTSKVTDMHSMFFDVSALVDIDAIADWDTSSVTTMSYMFCGASSLTNIDGAAGWDTAKVTTMQYMFSRTPALTNIDGAVGWDTSSVTNMSYMFYGASALANIDGASDWDTSSVTTMAYMFRDAFSLVNIDGAVGWDTSSVTNMSYMFYGNSALIDIDGVTDWDTSSVTNMYYMFYGTSALANIDAVAGWDTSSVTTMAYMFAGASALTNIDAVADWDTSKVTSLAGMFRDASSLVDIDAVADWDTSKVADMSNMFYGASSLANIDGATDWDTSKVRRMQYMFYGASALADIDGATNWNTSSVVDMSYMFCFASALANIDGAVNWNTSSVTNMNYMFNNASSLTNIDGASGWDTSSVTSMSYMFFNASSLTNIDGATGWDTGSVTTMADMFSGASSLTNIDGATGWNTGSVTTMAFMFQKASALTNIDGASGWDTSSVTRMSAMFSDASALVNIDGAADWDTSNVTTMEIMFQNAFSLSNIDGAINWDTSSVTAMGSMFYGAKALTNIDSAANWDTANVTTMAAMFSGASALTNIDGAAGWDTSKVITMKRMFQNASALANIDGAVNWNTLSVTNMVEMFNGATALTNIDALADWDTSSVTNMSNMFQKASSLANIDGASDWDTSSVTNMSNMFYNATALTNIDALADWDTSSVTNMSYMFYNAAALTNIDGASRWDTSSVTSMNSMFQGASSLADIDGASNWDTSKVTSLSYMFFNDRQITSLQPIFNWSVQDSTTKTNMFYGIPASVERPGWY